jgi:hypothetical protein
VYARGQKRQSGLRPNQDRTSKEFGTQATHFTRCEKVNKVAVIISRFAQRFLLLLVAGALGALMSVLLGRVSDNFDQSSRMPMTKPAGTSQPPAIEATPNGTVKPVVRQVRFVKKSNLDQFRSALLLLLYPGSSTITPAARETMPATLMEEDPAIRKYYRSLLAEKQRWDRYRLDKYHHILETNQEPERIEPPAMAPQNEANRILISELAQTLQLHTQLLRDVRMFHDEVRFIKEQARDGHEHRLYEHKYKLAPFAREAALADALQQALSALSAGLYQDEALEVIERLSAEYTRPVSRLQGQMADPDDLAAAITYNYNIFIVYGKKLMRFSDMLLQQSRVGLATPAFGELDYFYRRLSQSFDDLEQMSQTESFPPTHLDPKNLTRE